MSAGKSIALLLILVACSLTFSLLLHDNLGFDARIINDYSDRGIYAEEGLWLARSKIPYTESFSEYPQVALYFFAVPHILVSLINPRGSHSLDYPTVFSLLMMVFSFVSILTLRKLLDNDRKNLALLLLLPASFYFTFNRFDIMPCCFTLQSVYFFSKGQYKGSAVFLAVGVLTKWYLVLLLPIFLAYYFSVHKRIPWAMLITFGLTGLVIVLPTLLTGGIEGLVFPYKFHLTTEMNNESLLSLMDYGVRQVLKVGFANSHTFSLFLLLQFVTIPFCLTSRVASLDKVIKWCALALLTFLLFAKFYSPQWILWVSPFLILKARKKADVLWLILFDLLTYLYFPIGFDIFGEASGAFMLLIALKTIFLIGFIVPLVGELAKDNLVLAFFAERRSK